RGVTRDNSSMYPTTSRCGVNASPRAYPRKSSGEGRALTGAWASAVPASGETARATAIANGEDARRIRLVIMSRDRGKTAAPAGRGAGAKVTGSGNRYQGRAAAMAFPGEAGLAWSESAPGGDGTPHPRHSPEAGGSRAPKSGPPRARGDGPQAAAR